MPYIYWFQKMSVGISCLRYRALKEQVITSSIFGVCSLWRNKQTHTVYLHICILELTIRMLEVLSFFLSFFWTTKWLEEWVTVLITDLHCRPSAYEVRGVIYNVDYRSDCLWESCAFNTTGLKEKTERKITILKTTLLPTPTPNPHSLQYPGL